MKVLASKYKLSRNFVDTSSDNPVIGSLLCAPLCADHKLLISLIVHIIFPENKQKLQLQTLISPRLQLEKVLLLIFLDENFNGHPEIRSV